MLGLLDTKCRQGFTEDDISEADASDTTEGPDIDHFDFSNILQQLPHLTELSIVYGVRDAGMNFEWNLFQVGADWLCTLYIVHYTLYIVHCTLYIVHCTLVHLRTTVQIYFAIQ